MASLCMNSSLPLSPSSHPRNLTQTSLSSSSSSSLFVDNNNNNHHHNSLRTTSTLKPIVVSGNPPTFVSAPGRTILAGLFFFFRQFCLWCFMCFAMFKLFLCFFMFIFYFQYEFIFCICHSIHNFGVSWISGWIVFIFMVRIKYFTCILILNGSNPNRVRLKFWEALSRLGYACFNCGKTNKSNILS